jgi:DNA-binding HxlR family transcriptional regulator
VTSQTRIQHINDDEGRRFTETVELIGKRWSASILVAIARDSHRFSEIVNVVPGLSDRLLAQRLRELELAGLVEREVIPSTPVQVRYNLTESGTDLVRAMDPIVEWGQRWRPSPAPVQHSPAGQ